VRPQRNLSLFVREDVAVLYVDAKGPYPSKVTHWADAKDDATKYEGPLPIVAHPPCGPWGSLRHLSKHDDPALALRAVEQVRTYGGVLEHPQRSKLWGAASMPLPGEPADRWGGFTIHVNQVDFGHVARKSTWLYIVGSTDVPEMPAAREPTHWISGGRKRRVKNAGGCIPPGIKACSEQQRRRTPDAFADWLIELASRCRR
jgi:hypothetical protein